jgi:hypothetical protein
LSAPDPQLEQLARVLEADAPQPDPVFASEMDRRVADDFRERGGLRFPRFRLALAPALAAAAAVIAAVLAIALSGGDEKSRTAVNAHTGPSLAVVPAAGPGIGSGRKMERAIHVAIASPPKMIQGSSDRVGAVTRDRGGYVVSSELSTSANGRRSGRFVVRIDAAQVEPALAQLTALGRVRTRSESAHDMTVPYRRVRRRLDRAFAERRALESHMSGVQGAQAERTRLRVRTLSAEVSALARRMQDYEARAFYTTVTVTVDQAPVR